MSGGPEIGRHWLQLHHEFDGQILDKDWTTYVATSKYRADKIDGITEINKIGINSPNYNVCAPLGRLISLDLITTRRNHEIRSIEQQPRITKYERNDAEDTRWALTLSAQRY